MNKEIKLLNKVLIELNKQGLIGTQILRDEIEECLVEGECEHLQKQHNLERFSKKWVTMASCSKCHKILHLEAKKGG